MASIIPKTFSTKLFFMLGLLTCLAAIGAAWSTYKVARTQQVENIQQKLITIATTISDLVDKEQFERLNTSGKQDDADFNEIKKLLSSFQKTNSDISYIYTMTKTDKTDSDGIIQFLVDPVDVEDSNENGMIDPEEEAAGYHEPYNAKLLAPTMLDGFKGPIAESEMTKDKWGVYLSGYAPIKSAKGEVLGIVGVDISAQTLANMSSAFITQISVVIAGILITAFLISFIMARHINKPVTILSKAFNDVKDGNFDTKVEIKTGDEFENLANTFNQMTEELKERTTIKQTLERYVSKEVSDILLKSNNDVSMDLQRQRVTVLFLDLEGFTDFAENIPPEDVALILNTYHTIMIEEIFKHQGTVDKLMADGLMALFGAPLQIEDQELNAVKAALAIRDAINNLDSNSGIPKLKVRVGINTGWAVVGNVGSGRIMDYTAIGKQVNIASRLEGHNKVLGTDILICPTTYQAVEHHYPADRIDDVQLKGVSEKMTVFSLN